MSQKLHPESACGEHPESALAVLKSAARRKTVVIAYDDTAPRGVLPTMRTMVREENPRDQEIAIAASNRKSIARYFASLRYDPCTDTECLRCKDRMETYTLCSTCAKLPQNYFEMGILQRTLYMLAAKKEKAGYNPESDEMGKSRGLWQGYFAPVDRPPPDTSAV